MKALHMISFILLAVGGLNWGLIGLGQLFGGADWNVVHLILGFSSSIENIVYVLVGLAAVWELVNHKQTCKTCSAGSSTGM